MLYEPWIIVLGLLLLVVQKDDTGCTKLSLGSASYSFCASKAPEVSEKTAEQSAEPTPEGE